MHSNPFFKNDLTLDKRMETKCNDDDDDAMDKRCKWNSSYWKGKLRKLNKKKMNKSKMVQLI